MPTGRDIVCIGASAGGLQPLIEIVHDLPANLDAALFVVVHTGAETPTMLPDILRNSGYLAVQVANEDRDIRTGCIYVAPPDHHLLLRRGVVRSVRGPRENGFRPAVDPLFRTAARAYGPRAVGVILSGGRNDGSAGLAAIKRRGGVAVVQQPSEAQVPQMPLSAIATVAVDHVLPTAEIARTIVRLATSRELGDRDVPPEETEPDPAEFLADALRTKALPGSPSGFTCPDCGGALWKVDEDGALKYRCHVGHGFTAESLLGEKDRELEHALWSALRSLEENASLRRRMADRVQSRWPDLAERYEKQALECDEQIDVLRGVLVEARNDADRGGNGSRSGSARGKRRSGVRRSAGARPARRAVSDRGRDG